MAGLAAKVGGGGGLEGTGGRRADRTLAAASGSPSGPVDGATTTTPVTAAAVARASAGRLSTRSGGRVPRGARRAARSSIHPNRWTAIRMPATVSTARATGWAVAPSIPVASSTLAARMMAAVCHR